VWMELIVDVARSDTSIPKKDNHSNYVV